jgi:predicted O-methyltransferase YrrM
MQDRVSEAVSKAALIEGWMSDGELRWLAESASTRRIIVEIGSWKGRSTKAMGASTPGVVYAVDHYKGSEGEAVTNEASALGSEKFSEILKRNLSDEIAAGHVLPVVADSVEAIGIISPLLKGGKPEMVFIDGTHKYDAVRRDIAAWMPLLSPGGLICGHDYAPWFPGVVQAVKELVPGFKRVADSIWYFEVP